MHADSGDVWCALCRPCLPHRAFGVMYNVALHYLDCNGIALVEWVTFVSQKASFSLLSPWKCRPLPQYGQLMLKHFTLPSPWPRNPGDRLSHKGLPGATSSGRPMVQARIIGEYHQRPSFKTCLPREGREERGDQYVHLLEKPIGIWPLLCPGCE